MCASIKDFYNTKKYAIWWTVGYIVATWTIMQYMFNFNIFSAYRWHQLMHAHLHGFAGLVFGILILAMVPLYVATTIVIARNNAPLFNFKITIPEFIKNFIKHAFTQTPMEEPQPESAPTPEAQPTPISEPTESQPKTLPETVPAEMRVAYERARDNIGRIQTSVFDLGNMTRTSPAPITETTMAPELEIPIPTDFDIADTEKIINDVPVFTDLNFDDDGDTIVPQIDDVKTITDSGDLVVKYLTAKSVPYTTENDIVITDKFAIVSHTDSDFWVADNESWFAAGKIRKSPITSVLETATARGVEPVLYLAADNIMDIDNLRSQWEHDGIRVIGDLKDLM